MKISIIEKTVSEVLGLLSSKMQAILIARFGLNGEKPKTLDAIGQTLGITRERVRQIEAAAFKKLKETKKSEDISSILNKFVGILEKQGGFLDINGFKKVMFKEAAIAKMGLLWENQLKILLNGHRDVYYKKGTGKFHGVWYLKGSEKQLEKIESVYEKIVSYFKANKNLIKLDKIKAVIDADDFCTSEEMELLFKDEYAKNRLETILRTGKLTGINLLNEWGLKAWKLIRPRGARERAYLVFKKHQKPLHFREITELINDHFDLKKPTIPETVCNAVIYFDEFIAVEYGVYALTEWNLFDEEIKNEIIEFLRQRAVDGVDKQDAFAKIDEISNHVENKLNKNIKTFIIQANLFDKKIFSRRGEGYMLKIGVVK